MGINYLEKTPTFQERCGRFGGTILRFVVQLPNGLTKTIVATQLCRSATSIGANACEARSAESRADFIHKMQVALKEAREVFHWLSILKGSGEADQEILSSLLKECDELIAIMVASVNTAKSNMRSMETAKAEKRKNE